MMHDVDARPGLDSVTRALPLVTPVTLAKSLAKSLKRFREAIWMDALQLVLVDEYVGASFALRDVTSSCNCQNGLFQTWNMMDLNAGLLEHLTAGVLTDKDVRLANSDIHLLDPRVLA